jgi:hypothetical protein
VFGLRRSVARFVLPILERATYELDTVLEVVADEKGPPLNSKRTAAFGKGAVPGL